MNMTANGVWRQFGDSLSGTNILLVGTANKFVLDFNYTPYALKNTVLSPGSFMLSHVNLLRIYPNRRKAWERSARSCTELMKCSLNSSVKQFSTPAANCETCEGPSIDLQSFIIFVEKGTN